MGFVSTLTNSVMPPLNINELGLVLFGTARAWRTKLDQRLRPLGLSQGKFKVWGDPDGQKYVHNLFHGKKPGPPITLDDLKRAVKGAAQ